MGSAQIGGVSSPLKVLHLCMPGVGHSDSMLVITHECLSKNLGDGGRGVLKQQC